MIPCYSLRRHHSGSGHTQVACHPLLFITISTGKVKLTHIDVLPRFLSLLCCISLTLTLSLSHTHPGGTCVWEVCGNCGNAETVNCAQLGHG